MIKKDKPKSLEEILKDTKHNSKAQEVFLKLLAKQKKPANPFGVVRSETYKPSTEIKQGVDTNDFL